MISLRVAVAAVLVLVTDLAAQSFSGVGRVSSVTGSPLLNPAGGASPSHKEQIVHGRERARWGDRPRVRDYVESCS